VVLPQHLRTLAGLEGELVLDVPQPVSPSTVLDALERRYPMLCGTIRDHATGKRRPMVRFFANEEDVTQLPLEHPLPAPVARGEKPFMIVGAIAGG
jgi:hypothetical protein